MKQKTALVTSVTGQDGAYLSEFLFSEDMADAWVFIMEKKTLLILNYGSKKGPVKLGDEIVSTQKGEIAYFHVLDTTKESYFIPNFKGKIKSMKYFDSQQNVAYETTKFGLLINIPKGHKDEIDTIIEVRMR